MKIVEKEFRRLLRAAPLAMVTIKRVTGKTGLANLNPLNEKRWGKKCWDAYETLVDLKVMLETGELAISEYEKALSEIKPTDEWLGHVSSRAFPASGGFEATVKRFGKVWPQ